MRNLILLLALLLPAQALAQDWAKSRLKKSPRHLEWVELKHGDRTLKAFVAYPERAEKAKVIVVIHEIFGLTDWARLMTDELAAAGYIAIAPDLLSGSGPNGGGTASLGGVDEARKAIRELPPDQITADLKAAVDYGLKLPAANGQVSVAGFCWGGTESFRFATNEKRLKAAYVFYGTGPDQVASIACPVYGFYAENDARVGATIEATRALMKKAGKTYQPVTYKGAGHGFMRAGEDPEGSAENKQARDQAWKRWMDLLK
ncbi:MAG: dienelactone hydrolase family protein [Candidatus Eremiobacteraeota bacterium]|nr:dienelactone hydrolase family protein [Candidatus Eremiobacteraeota bacterium]